MERWMMKLMKIEELSQSRRYLGIPSSITPLLSQSLLSDAGNYVCSARDPTTNEPVDSLPALVNVKPSEPGQFIHSLHSSSSSFPLFCTILSSQFPLFHFPILFQWKVRSFLPMNKQFLRRIQRQSNVGFLERKIPIWHSSVLMELLFHSDLPLMEEFYRFHRQRKWMKETIDVCIPEEEKMERNWREETQPIPSSRSLLVSEWEQWLVRLSSVLLSFPSLHSPLLPPLISNNIHSSSCSISYSHCHSISSSCPRGRSSLIPLSFRSISHCMDKGRWRATPLWFLLWEQEIGHTGRSIE